MAAVNQSSQKCVCGEKWSNVSQNQYAKEGWGSMNNFLLSYGLRPTPDGYQQGREILKQFIDGDRYQFMKKHEKCQQNNDNNNMITIRISNLLEENDEMDRPCFLKVNSNFKVEQVALFIAKRYKYPFRNIQISKGRGDHQRILKNNQTLKQQGIKNNDNLLWISFPGFLF